VILAAPPFELLVVFDLFVVAVVGGTPLGFDLLVAVFVLLVVAYHVFVCLLILRTFSLSPF
jgi:hypothetical protein